MGLYFLSRGHFYFLGGVSFGKMAFIIFAERILSRYYFLGVVLILVIFVFWAIFEKSWGVVPGVFVPGPILGGGGGGVDFGGGGGPRKRGGGFWGGGYSSICSISPP